MRGQRGEEVEGGREEGSGRIGLKSEWGEREGMKMRGKE